MIRNILFFDTETTGLVKPKKPPTDPVQPMPVQIGLKLDGEDQKERTAMNYMIQPEGWIVDPKAAEITGITNEIAEAYGVNIIAGYEVFRDTIKHADAVVAHNAMFDITVMRRTAKVYADMTEQEYVDPFKGKSCICTMLTATQIVQALPKRNGEYKWPKLEECMRFFFNESLEGAHDALVDVRATARVYYELKRMGTWNTE